MATYDPQELAAVHFSPSTRLATPLFAQPLYRHGRVLTSRAAVAGEFAADARAMPTELPRNLCQARISTMDVWRLR